MKMPASPFAFPAHRSPSHRPPRTKLRPSRLMSPKWPFRICQNRTDSQKLLSGAWAKVQGHGIAQLQLSNQSPTMRQLGTAGMWNLQIGQLETHSNNGTCQG